jgi:outer membrane protein
VNIYEKSAGFHMSSNVSFKKTVYASVAVVTLFWGAASACAESLSEALSFAYSGNPTLRAERARQRGTDEQVPQALSGWRPTVTAQGTFTESWTNSNVTKRVENSPGSVTIALSQPVFRGFKTINGTKSAEASVLAGRQNLLAVEQDVLFQAVQAYMNVIRDRQIVGLRQKNVSVLKQQLNAANERFKVGEITRTDVSQSRARVAQAQASVASATATLEASVASYEKVIGHRPSSLMYPKMPKLPRSLDAAQTAATEINPNILAAAYVEEAATYNIEVTKGDLLPELSVSASATVTDGPARGVRTSDSERIEGILTVPLYEAGSVYSSVRQSKHVASQRRLQVIEAGRAVREGVSNAWHFLESARQSISANNTQVSSNRLALDGVRQEYLVGSRTTLDVLDAESEVVTAQIALVSAQRDQIVSSYQILGSVGRLTARDLHLRVEYYDVEENYRAVRNKWFGTYANTVE